MSNNRELGYVVGAVVGYFTGGASYIALGATLGGFAGGLLDPAVQNQGPRLDDLKVQQSTYGIGITRLYGTQRISPNVVWSTDKLEFSNTSSSGKGGGGVENTTYRYFVQMRLLLCETPRDGSEVEILQMFADGKLQWDARSGIPVASALATAENPFAFFTLYQGHEDQLPDAIEETYESGAGSVPAYRGVVTLAVRGVECPGGRVPQYSVVLSNNAIRQTTSEEITAVPAAEAGADQVWAVVRKDDIWHFAMEGADFLGTAEMKVFKAGFGYANEQRIISWPFLHTSSPPIPVSGDGDAIALRMRFLGSNYGQPIVIERVNLDDGTLSVVLEYTPITEANTLGVGVNCSASYNASRDRYVMRGGGSERNTSLTFFTAGSEQVRSPTIPGSLGAVYIDINQAYVLSFSGGTVNLVFVDPDNGDILGGINGPATSAPMLSWSALSGNEQGDIYAWYRDDGIAATTYAMVKFKPLAGTWEYLNLEANTNVAEKQGNRATTIYATDYSLVLGPSQEFDLQHTYSLVRFNTLMPGGTNVGAVIAAECEAAGETRYDVSAISDADTLQGYAISSPASARANIDPLLTAFQLYVVDEDGAIKFKKLASLASVATVSFEELGQAEGESSSDPMPLTRTQTIDMPRSVSVSYLEPANDYQVATEREVRQVTDATEDVLTQLPMAISSDQAKKAATNMLFARWRKQNTRAATVSRKYAFVSPGDGLTIEYPQGTFRLWRVVSVNDTGAIVELKLEPGDTHIFTQEAKGATGYVTQQVSPLVPPTQSKILDLPLLSDAGNDAGPYVALDAVTDLWAGADLLAGPSQTNLSQIGRVTQSAPVGLSNTRLGDWEGGQSVDEYNTFVVNVGNDTLSNISREVMLSSTENSFALGKNGRWEICQFQRATSAGAGKFILSGLRRGLRGTEANIGNHEKFDTFVLLDPAGLLKPTLSAASIGTPTYYKTVSIGRRAESATTLSYVNTGEALRPFSPVDLRKSVQGGDIVLSWHRRTRLTENVLLGILPLGENFERYEVDVHDPGAGPIKRTISTSTKSAIYTAAMQTEDGYAPGTPLTVSVYQISDMVGRGHALKETL